MNKKYLYLKYKEKGLLDDYINNTENTKLNLTQKLIISYGIANALKYLHNNNVVHRNIEPSNIFLDSNLYPFVFNYHRAKHTKIYFPFMLK